MQRRLFFIVSALVAIAALAAFFLFRSGPRQTISSSTPSIVGARYVFGSQNAPVTVVEFANYLCPHCADFALKVAPLIIRDYVDTGKVRMVLRDFPFPGQEKVIVASEAAACAAAQGRFDAYHKVLYRGQTDWVKLSGDSLQDNFVSYAGELGLNVAEFRTCLESGKERPAVIADQKAALAQGMGVTPSYLVNGKRYQGFMSYARWRQILNGALAANK